VRRMLELAVLAAGVACGGSSEDADPLEDGADIVAPGPDSADCPARNHLAVEFNGRRRSGIEEPIDYSFLEARSGGCKPVRFNPCEPWPRRGRWTTSRPPSGSWRRRPG
jgi:hypothetical protein